MERTPEAQVGMQWWEKSEIDLVGARETAAATVAAEAEADEDGVEEWRRRQKWKTPRPGHR